MENQKKNIASVSDDDLDAVIEFLCDNTLKPIFTPKDLATPEATATYFQTLGQYLSVQKLHEYKLIRKQQPANE